MEEHEIEKMGIKELAKYMDVQQKLGKKKERTQGEIAKIRGISLTTLKKQTDPFRNKGEQTGIMNEKESTETIQENTNNVQESTPKNTDFSEKEIKVLKQIIKEREINIKSFHEFQIYKELEKVPVDADTVRSAFNMSKGTTERLKKYSQVRRIPLQDLVELAVIDLLNKYEGGK